MIYFCSGLILFNISALRKKYSLEKYIKVFLEIQDKTALPDQDLLNYVHRNEVKLVDEMKYGMFTQTAHKMGITYAQAKEQAVILHFTGQAKPWTVNLVRYDIEKIWWEYAKETPYYYPLMEQVFFQSMDSHLAENTFQKLSDENAYLKELLIRMRTLIQKAT